MEIMSEIAHLLGQMAEQATIAVALVATAIVAIAIIAEPKNRR